MTTIKQPEPPLNGTEEYRTITATVDVKTMRCRGLKVLSTSPLTVGGCSAFPDDGITVPAFVEIPVELPDGAINVFDIKINGYVDMSFAPVVPPGTIIYEKRDVIFDGDGNKTETIRTLYHEGSRCHDVMPSGADSGMRTLISNPKWCWENNDTTQRYVVVKQELALGLYSDDQQREDLRDMRVSVLASRTPQTLEALDSHPSNGLPAYWSPTNPGPRTKRIVWVRLTGHRVEQLMIFSVSLKVRGVFSDGVTVASHTRKPRAARKVKAKPSPTIQVAPAANVASAAIELSESVAAQCGS